MTGLRVPGYGLAEIIGRGGFATVYRARQERVGRDVALKIMQAPDVTPEELDRFRDECTALAQLGWNRNVVQIFDAGVTDDGRPFLAMELLDGGSAAELLRRGPFAEADVRKCGEQVASALAAAHTVGVLHRDVKPDNVLVDRGGNYRLADFGIASLTGGTRTATGLVSGTVAFMAPEIVLGQRATQQSDIFSLGATLYTLASGSSPFVRPTDESPVSALHRIVNEEPPPLESYGVSQSLASVLRSAMHREPGRRFPSAEHLERALTASSASPAIPVDRTVLRTSLATISAPPPSSHSSVTGPVASSPPAATEPARPVRRGALVAIVGASALVVASVIGGMMLIGRGSSPSDAGRSSPTDPSASNAPPPVDPSTVTVPVGSAPLPATTLSSLPSTATTPPPAAASTTLASTTVVRTTSTIAATLPPPPIELPTEPTLTSTQPPTDFDTGVSASEAAGFFRSYFLAAGAREYSTAWAMCSPRYQLKYKSYEKFVAFWDSIDLAGIDRTVGEGVTQQAAAILRADVWFKTFAGAISKETIRIEVLRADNGTLVLDDYVFLGQR